MSRRCTREVLWSMLALLVLASLSCLASAASAQDSGPVGGGSSEIVRGTVVGPDGQPVAGAQVTVTALGSGETRTTHTNDHGEYVVLFGEGTGQYVVAVRAIGLARTVVRVVKPLGGDADPVLESRIAMGIVRTSLDTVEVLGQGGVGADSSIGGSGQNALQGALFSLDPSDLARLAARVPGVAYLQGAGAGLDSFSVLGAAADQNDVQVDGVSTRGGLLPGGAIASARMNTTTYDATQGGFAGGQLSLITRKGSDKFEGSLSSTLSDPHLAWADPTSLSPIPRRYSVDGSVGGPIEREKLRYFSAFQVQRTGNSTPTLDDPTRALLDRFGVGADTIGVLGSTLESLGVPRTMSSIPGGEESDQLSGFARLDWLPTATSTLTTTFQGSVANNGGNGLSPLAFSSVANRSRASSLGITSKASAYVAGLMDEVNVAFQRNVQSTDPYLFLPHGQVRVGADFSDGRSGLAQLDFGGGTSGISRNTTSSWHATNALHWLPHRSRHAITFGQELHIDRTSSLSVANPYGQFTFLTLDDLAANRPASYSRTISSRERATSAVTGAFSLDDKFRVSPIAHLEYGVRVDLAHSGTRPAYNAVVDSLYGRRTDFAPTDVGVSPRLGFDVLLGRRAAPTDWWRDLRIDGGIGAFHGVIPPSRIASLVDATGLPDAVRQLTCAGDATPVPDWTRYASDSGAVPSACLDGSAPVEFSSDRPSVMLFDPAYRAPTSWRGNLAIGGLRVKGWGVSAQAQLSREVHVEGSMDLNLRDTPAFTLPAEDDRPVYASPDAIVPGTGVVAPGASRVSDRFSAVRETRSDLRTYSSQFGISLAPPEPLFGRISYNLQYTHTSTRTLQRGFDGSTAGNPFLLEWATNGQPRDQLDITANLYAGRWGGISLQTRISSGLSYTPMVSGDVNGDGMSNDRAFVFDPAATADSAMAAQMQTLLGSAPPAVRSCLRRQVGTIAGANSCRTGWLIQPNVQIELPSLPFMGRDVWLGDHLQLTVTAQNAMGALLRLAGLSNTSLGWAFGNYPLDPTLLYVDGFDPDTRAFHYRVNQNFGYGGRSATRGATYVQPFQVVIGAKLQIGGPPRDEMARGLGLVSEEGRAPEDLSAVSERLQRLTMDPVAMLLGLRDSLLLTEQQVQGMERIRVELRARNDTTLRPLAEWIVKHQKHLSDRDLTNRIAKYSREMSFHMADALAQAVGELTEAQKKRLPRGMLEGLDRLRRMKRK
ncbi:MAG TPA: carboxypeptidase-like regulatory domain-containing protein [Gemmatimonadaceae bacterium]|nr:carboxypeptidase-like regulatory domain-containing protein [Gemmatimonadaceae bacterium]